MLITHSLNKNPPRPRGRNGSIRPFQPFDLPPPQPHPIRTKKKTLKATPLPPPPLPPLMPQSPGALYNLIPLSTFHRSYSSLHSPAFRNVAAYSSSNKILGAATAVPRVERKEVVLGRRVGLNLLWDGVGWEWRWWWRGLSLWWWRGRGCRRRCRWV